MNKALKTWFLLILTLIVFLTSLLSPPSPSSCLTPSSTRQFTVELPTFFPANSLLKLTWLKLRSEFERANNLHHTNRGNKRRWKTKFVIYLSFSSMDNFPLNSPFNFWMMIPVTKFWIDSNSEFEKIWRKNLFFFGWSLKFVNNVNNSSVSSTLLVFI